MGGGVEIIGTHHTSRNMQFTRNACPFKVNVFLCFHFFTGRFLKIPSSASTYKENVLRVPLRKLLVIHHRHLNVRHCQLHLAAAHLNKTTGGGVVEVVKAQS